MRNLLDGRKLKAALKKKKLAQGELAARTGVSQAQISQLIHRKRGASLQTLRTISDVLEVPIETLIYRKETKG